MKYNSSIAVHEEERANKKADEIPKKGQQKGPFLKNNIKKDKKEIDCMYVACIEAGEQATTPTPPPSVLETMQNVGLKLTNAAKNTAQEWVNQYGENRVLAALETAAEHDGRSGVTIAYVTAILEDRYNQRRIERIREILAGRKSACL